MIRLFFWLIIFSIALPLVTIMKVVVVHVPDGLGWVWRQLWWTQEEVDNWMERWIPEFIWNWFYKVTE